jgi:hypothetical protein
LSSQTFPDPGEAGDRPSHFRVEAHPVQLVVHPFGIVPTPTIQLALHVEDEPGIHRARPRRTFLLRACRIHCLPSPCGRLSRPRTTMQAPPPLVVIAGRLGHPEGNVQRVPRFRCFSLSCCRARLYPVGIRTGGLRSGVRRLTKGVPFAPGLHSRKAGRLSLSLEAALPTSALARLYTLTRRQASVRIAAHGRIASRASRRVGSHGLPDVDRFC